MQVDVVSESVYGNYQKIGLWRPSLRWFMEALSLLVDEAVTETVYVLPCALCAPTPMTIDKGDNSADCRPWPPSQLIGVVNVGQPDPATLPSP